MMMASVDDSSVQVDSQPRLVDLVWGWQLLDTILHSSDEPHELSQRLCHDDSNMNFVLNISVIIVIVIVLDDDDDDDDDDEEENLLTEDDLHPPEEPTRTSNDDDSDGTPGRENLEDSARQTDRTDRDGDVDRDDSISSTSSESSDTEDSDKASDS